MPNIVSNQMMTKVIVVILTSLILCICFYIKFLHYNVSIPETISKAEFTSKFQNTSIRKVRLNKSGLTSFINKKKKEISEEIKESYELSKDVRILCWVMTNPKNHQTKAQKVKETWGKRCNILLFMSSTADPNLPSVQLNLDHDGRDRLWAKTKQSFQYAYKYYRDQADWFLKADDDTYVILENLRYMLKDYKSTDPSYFGLRFVHHEYTQHKEGYMSGGAGYVLSGEALDRFVNKALNGNTLSGICNHKQDTGNEDVEIGLCLNSVGVNEVDTRDKDEKHRFQGDTLEKWMHTEDWSAIEKSYSFYPMKPGMSCCSERPITFHYVTPGMMLALEYLIYHAKPFGGDSSRWFISAPKPTSLQAAPTSESRTST